MMYNQKLVAVIKANGRILRETNGTVHIPFGQEYSIQIKNLHTEKAVVSIDIDGENVTDGSRYIIYPNDTVEIEGFLKGNNVTRKFKFIEKTEAISEFRGDNMEDGLVKFTYQFEKAYEPTLWYNTGWNPNQIIGGSNNFRAKSNISSGGYTGGGSSGDVTFTSNVYNVNCSLDSMRGFCDDAPVAVAGAAVASANDNGITGKGSKSDQSFRNGHVGVLESTKHSMVIQLKGGVEKPIYVQTKLQCDMCGRKWPSKNEYCGSCGHALRD